MDAQAIRERIGKLRDGLSEAEREAKAELIWKRLAELPEFQTASQALFYLSFKSEVDTTLMRELARELGMAVAAPRANKGEKRMTFYYLDDENELESGPYGILQPPQNSEKIVELEDATVILVPGLAYDLQCRRLGWGAGFYDRFLAGEGKGIPTIGLAFDCQIVDEVPTEPHDVPVNVVVTESRVIRPS